MDSQTTSKDVKKEPVYSDVTTTKDLITRAAVLGVISFGLGYYLYSWANYLRVSRSQTGVLWIPEYQFNPGSEGPHETFLKYDYREHYEMLKILALGTVNIFFYAMFLCDALTLMLPKSLQYLDILPFVLAFVDFVENGLYFFMLVQFPERTAVSPFVGHVTLVKNVLGAFIAGLIVISLVSLPIRWLTGKSETKPKSQ